MLREMLLSASIAASCALTAQAQDVPDDLVLELQATGFAGIEPHEKDAAAHGALMMLGERLGELPGELGGPDEARDAIDLVWAWLAGNTGLRLSQTDQAPGLSLALSVEAHGVGADAFSDRVVSMLEMADAPIDEDADGMYLSTPLGRARLGTHAGAVTMMLGTDEPAALATQSFDLPDEAASILSGRVHLARLGDFIRKIAREEEPELSDFIEDNAWLVEEAPLFDFAFGADAERQYLVSRSHDAMGWASRMGMDSSMSISRAELTMVPQDATLVSGAILPMDMVIGLIEYVSEQSGEDIFGEIERETGLDVRGDVLENLGPSTMYYQSLSTGGGGLLSGVMIVGLKDVELAGRVHDDLRDRVNDFAGDAARGYVRISSWDTGMGEAFSLTTPGIPMPIEFSWAIVGDHFVASVTQSGLQGAIRAIIEDGPSVLEHEVLGPALSQAMERGTVTAVRASDSKWFAERGYGAASLLSSALANAVRSPSDPSREAGILIPAYNEFAEGIAPMIAVEYWDGDDYVTHMELDGSVLVEIAEAYTQIGGTNGLIALGALQSATMLPALGQARASSKQLKSATQVRSLGMAIVLWGDSNDYQSPDSYEQLTDNGLIDPELLNSPFGPSFDGEGDIVMRTTLADDEMFSYKANVIVAIDRAMYMNGEDGINVGFADSHVRYMPIWEFEELLDEPQNEGAREDFMLD